MNPAMRQSSVMAGGPLIRRARFALDAFTCGMERWIDTAKVNGRLFLNSVSLGSLVLRSAGLKTTEYRQWRVAPGPFGNKDPLTRTAVVRARPALLVLGR